MARAIRNRYELIEEVGRGGEGRVVLARDRQHDRLVALKERKIGASTVREELLAEARVLLGLRPHPNLPLVREDFFDGSRYYVAMDWVQGEDLAHVLRDDSPQGLPAETAIGYLVQAAAALDHLGKHEPPVVHGDVKPSNLILTKDDRVVLVDFGIAGSSARRARRMRTEGFSAPEVAAPGRPGPAADVFSFAATAFALLTGTAPKPGSADAFGGPPKALVAIRRSLSIDPSKRHPTAGALVADLAAAYGIEPAGVAAGRASPRRSARSHSVAFVAVLAAVVAVGVGVPLALVLSRGDAPEVGGPPVSEPLRQTIRADARATILLNSALSELRIVPNEGADVVVEAVKHATSKSLLKSVRLKIRREGNTISLAAETPNHDADLEFTKLAVPRDARIEISVMSATVSGLARGAKIVTTVGDITLADVKGSLQIQTGSGAVRATGADGVVTVSSTTGDVSISGRITGSSSFTSGSGAITVEGVVGAVNAQTSTGDITLKGHLRGTNAVRSGSGAVTIQDVTGTLTSTSTTGDISVGRLAGTGRFETGSGAITVAGVNGTVTASTTVADIRIAGRLRGQNVITSRSGSVDVTIPGSSRLVVTAKGSSCSSEFGLRVVEPQFGPGATMKGRIGDGREGSLRMETTIGDVSLRRM
jgi:serine/threonine protein kinase